MTDESEGKFARYCYDKEKINKHRVHHRLFSPRNNKLSVQCIDNLQTHKVEEIGRMIRSDRCLYGWGTLDWSNFERQGLSVHIDNDPTPGHANVQGWPKEPDILVEIRKNLAQAATDAVPNCVRCCSNS